MKKILFYGGLLALATSCADQEFEGLKGDSGKTEGISFVTAEANTRIQYDKEGSVWNPFWYAEQDRITIFANGVTLGGKTTTGYDAWNKLAATGADYKATKSESQANFTSINDANLLTFVADKTGKKEAKFFAVYPSTTEKISVVAKTTKGQPDTLAIANIFDGLASQKVTTAKGENKAVVMFAHATAKQEAVYEAVGEKVALQFEYATPIIKVGTKNLSDEYQKAFGKLTGITLENTGYTDAKDAKKNIAAPALTYAAGATLQVDTLNWASEIKPAAAAGANKITATVGTTGLAWSDAALAPIAVARADRSAFRKAGVKDTLETMMQFEKIDLLDTRKIDVDFAASSNFLAITVDLSKYPWLVTKETTKGSSNDRALFVNSGKLADIFADDKGNIKWTDSQTTGDVVPATQINTVVIKAGVEIAAADYAVLNKLTNIKHLTIEGLETVPAKAFEKLTAMTTLRLPAATSFANKNAIVATALDSIVMPAYNFEDKDINDVLLKKASLRYIDMGATVMNAGFPAKGLSLEGFSKLYEAKVKDGIKVGANAFKKCTSLKKVVGRVDIVGTYAFSDDAALTSINISSQDIVSGAFNGCAALETKNLKVNGAALAPTSVGKEAFKGAKKINVDLDNCTSVGESAFEGAIALKGIKHTGEAVEVLRVGAATVGANAFKGCTALKYIYLKEVTAVSNGIFDSATLNEIKFGKKFAVVPQIAAGSFGTTTNTKLFVQPGQEGVSGNVLTTKSADGKTPAVTHTFGQIIEEQ